MITNPRLEKSGTMVDGVVWYVLIDYVIIARICLDTYAQVKEVVLHSNASEEDRILVLRLATWHAMNFIRNRKLPSFGGILLNMRQNRALRDEDSDRYMDFNMIQGNVVGMNKTDLTLCLDSIGIDRRAHV